MVDLTTNWKIVRNPCDQSVTNQNWGKVADALQQMSENINTLNSEMTILNGGDTNITEVITNYFSTNTTVVTNIVENYLTNYFNSLYANSIAFTLDSQLALSGGIWQGSATVTHSWLGAAPPSTVTVLDPAGKWRWTAPTGAKGTAIRASEDGTIYQIITLRTIAPMIQFTSRDTFTTASTVTRSKTVPKWFEEAHSPEEIFGTTIYIANAAKKGGGYIFEGDIDDYGFADLIFNENQPANSGTEPVYMVVQEECP